MELDITKFLAQGKFEGDFAFRYTPTEELCLIPLCHVEGEVEVSGSYVIYDDDSVGVNLKIAYTIAGQCSYCLSDAWQRIDYGAEILFLPEKNDDDYYYDGKKIVLDAAVNETILISQPGILLCREDCKGIVVK